MTDYKKRGFLERLFLSGQLNPTELCSTIAELQKSHNLFPDIKRFATVPSNLTKKSASKNDALQYLSRQVVNLSNDEKRLEVDHRRFLQDSGLTSDPEQIVKFSKHAIETFLYHVAYFLQKIQEAEEEVKVAKEEREPEFDTQVLDEGDEDDIELHEIDFAQRFPWSKKVTKEIQKAVPLKSMMTPVERKWFTEYAPYISGKPRCITRVVNCYNLGRYVAEKVTPKEIYKHAATSKRKLMKLIILAEFWPYRTAFLMQIAVS